MNMFFGLILMRIEPMVGLAEQMRIGDCLIRKNIEPKYRVTGKKNKFVGLFRMLIC